MPYPCTCCIVTGGGPCTPDSKTFATCVDGGFSIVACLHTMLAVVQLEFTDGETIPGCPWSLIDGPWVFPPSIAPFRTPFDSPDSIQRLLDELDEGGLGCSSIFYDASVSCPRSGVLMHLSYECTGDVLNITWQLYNAIVDCESNYFITASASVPLPITLTSGITFTFTSFSGSSIVPISGTVTFYGRPCVDTCDVTAPTVGITATPRTVTAIVTCDIPPTYDDVPTCQYDLTVSIDGGTCPTALCIWHDGVIGCNRDFYHLGGGACGIHEETIGVWVINTRGCIVDASVAIACCECCAPVGASGIIVGLWTDPGGIIPSCDPVSVEICAVCETALFCFAVCRYTIQFPAIINEGECGTSWWLVADWGCMTHLDGSPILQTCFVPGEIIDVEHNAGGLGCDVCLEATPVNNHGCVGPTEYFPFPQGTPCDKVCPPAEPLLARQLMATKAGTIARTVTSEQRDAAKKHLGDLLEEGLISMGITKERYIAVKDKFGLPPMCNCPERIAWLNKQDEDFRAAVKSFFRWK